jgi:hypothetical protein
MRDELHETTRAIIAADEAHLQAVTDAALWERRGLLQTLTHMERPAAGWWRRALRLN